MQKILENLKDPSWWFTAVFIGIVASVLAAFFHSILTAALSTVSMRYRAWQERKKAEEEREIMLIASDNTLLLGECIRAAVLTMFVLFLLLDFFGCYVAYKFAPLADSNLRVMLIVQSLFAGVFLIFVSPRVSAYIGTALGALKKHRKKVKDQLNKGIKPDNQ
jgi:hypothetical protein